MTTNDRGFDLMSLLPYKLNKMNQSQNFAKPVHSNTCLSQACTHHTKMLHNFTIDECDEYYNHCKL